MIYCAESTGGFYDTDIHGKDIPVDAMEISKAERARLLAGQSSGKFIAFKDGIPYLVDPVPPSAHEIATAEQSACITTANQQIAIIKPAVDGGYAKPEHIQLLADWQRYRYELTLVPEQSGWPASPQWPTEPDKVI
ncbi:tail fiber assembly protein [Aeromonas veronii]|uniref:tail fiber assembly protein n=1 Tax=Aeromonas veronii TaxID=654 RepID=UPI0002804BAA|nr:tail fiber assembly protein [Aeromonas veronii]EKB14529.1 hypothetical protein HMPREF1169_01807 [Aeromonas veronii AER397]